MSTLNVSETTIQPVSNEMDSYGEQHLFRNTKLKLMKHVNGNNNFNSYSLFNHPQGSTISKEANTEPCASTSIKKRRIDESELSAGVGLPFRESEAYSISKGGQASRGFNHHMLQMPTYSMLSPAKIGGVTFAGNVTDSQVAESCGLNENNVPSSVVFASQLIAPSMPPNFSANSLLRASKLSIPNAYKVMGAHNVLETSNGGNGLTSAANNNANQVANTGSHNAANNTTATRSTPNEGDYDIVVGEHFNSLSAVYEVLSFLGRGTFGQVVKCRCLSSNRLVAIKILKNHPSYQRQGIVEISILQTLSREDTDAHNLVRAIECFQHRSHMCLVFELLEQNLYDYLKAQKFRPLSLSEIRPITQQVLVALSKLKQLGLIHADLKPENIMLVNHTSHGRANYFRVKVIDFGSACHSSKAVPNTYLQSRYYRAPEILLGLPFNESIDMWSLGCVLAELYLGWPLYPGSSEYDQMRYIVATQGLPPAHMLAQASKEDRYFKIDAHRNYHFKQPEEYTAETGQRSKEARKYIFSSLSAIEDAHIDLRRSEMKDTATILDDGFRPLMDQVRCEAYVEARDRREFSKLLCEMLSLVAQERIVPDLALQHSFITMSHLHPFVNYSKRARESLCLMQVCNDQAQQSSGNNCHFVSSTPVPTNVTGTFLHPSNQSRTMRTAHNPPPSSIDVSANNSHQAQQLLALAGHNEYGGESNLYSATNLLNACYALAAAKQQQQQPSQHQRILKDEIGRATHTNMNGSIPLAQASLLNRSGLGNSAAPQLPREYGFSMNDDGGYAQSTLGFIHGNPQQQLSMNSFSNDPLPRRSTIGLAQCLDSNESCRGVNNMNNVTNNALVNSLTQYMMSQHPLQQTLATPNPSILSFPPCFEGNQRIGVNSANAFLHQLRAFESENNGEQSSEASSLNLAVLTAQQLMAASLMANGNHVTETSLLESLGQTAENHMRSANYIVRQGNGMSVPGTNCSQPMLSAHGSLPEAITSAALLSSQLAANAAATALANGDNVQAFVNNSQNIPRLSQTFLDSPKTREKKAVPVVRVHPIVKEGYNMKPDYNNLGSQLSARLLNEVSNGMSSNYQVASSQAHPRTYEGDILSALHAASSMSSGTFALPMYPGAHQTNGFESSLLNNSQHHLVSSSQQQMDLVKVAATAYGMMMRLASSSASTSSLPPQLSMPLPGTLEAALLSTRGGHLTMMPHVSMFNGSECSFPSINASSASSNLADRHRQAMLFPFSGIH